MATNDNQYTKHHGRYTFNKTMVDFWTNVCLNIIRLTRNDTLYNILFSDIYLTFQRHNKTQH